MGRATCRERVQKSAGNAISTPHPVADRSLFQSDTVLRCCCIVYKQPLRLKATPTQCEKLSSIRSATRRRLLQFWELLSCYRGRELSNLRNLLVRTCPSFRYDPLLITTFSRAKNLFCSKGMHKTMGIATARWEERRVGKECRNLLETQFQLPILLQIGLCSSPIQC